MEVPATRKQILRCSV